MTAPGRRRAEAIVVALLFLAAAWWGARAVTRFVAAGGQPSFYQHYFEPAVMLACGRGFTASEGARPPVLDDFLFRRIETLDCAQLPPDLAVGTRNVFQYGWFYLVSTVGVVWMIGGVSWGGLVPLFGVLFGVVIVLAYALFRTTMPLPPAVVTAVVLAVSPLHLQNLPHLRDYAKAPFVLALILILVLLVLRPMTTRALLALAAAYGAILGVGYGFRTDLLANIPPFVVTVLFFLPGGVVRDLAAKGAALALAAVMFVALSWPASTHVIESGGCQWHVALLGLSSGFDPGLMVTRPFYDWTPVFSDEYVHAGINSYAARMWQAGPVAYCSAAYDAASGAQLREILMQFPADTVARAYGSILRILDLPFFLWRETWDSTRGSSWGALMHLAAGSARLAAVAAVILLSAVSLRLGLFALCAVIYFGGYPSVQFADRHFFHLEFLGWWVIGGLAWLIVVAATKGLPPAPVLKAGTARAGAFAAATMIVLVAPLLALRWYQHERAELLVSRLLAAPRVPVAMAAAADGGLDVAADALPELGSSQGHSAYLDVHVDLTACPQGVSLIQRYDPARTAPEFSGPVRPAGTRAAERILLPAYPYFEGFTVEDGPVSCIARVERLQSIEGLPLLPVLALATDWRTRPAHQELRR